MFGLNKPATACVIGRASIDVVRVCKVKGAWTLVDLWSGSAPDSVDPSGIKEAVKSAVDEAGIEGAVSLTFSDAYVRTALLDFKELPEKRREKETIIKWRTTKELYLKPEDWRVEFFEMPAQVDRRVLSVALKNDVSSGYEDAFDALNVEIEKIGVNSINLYNLVASEIVDTATAAVFLYCGDMFTSMIFKNGTMDMCNNKACVGGDEFLVALASSYVLYLDKNPQVNFDKTYVFCDDVSLYDGIREATTSHVVIVTPETFVKTGNTRLDPGNGIKILSAIGLIG